MKSIVIIFFLGLTFICFGQNKAKLEDGTIILVYPDKTWKYESEIQAANVDSNAIFIDLKDPLWGKVWKHPFAFYSTELNDFSQQNVELLGYSNDYFLVKSTTGQIGFVSKLGIENSDNYINVLENRIIQKAKTERKFFLIKGIGVDEINSAGGVDIFIDWGYFDYSKIIKYISFTVIPYNNVGDIQTCKISGKSAITGTITGPISASDSFNPSNYGVPTKWENVWYNNTITWIKLTKVVVEYMDGTSYSYVNELPKIFDNKYINVNK